MSRARALRPGSAASTDRNEASRGAGARLGKCAAAVRWRMPQPGSHRATASQSPPDPRGKSSRSTRRRSSAKGRGSNLRGSRLARSRRSVVQRRVIARAGMAPLYPKRSLDAGYGPGYSSDVDIVLPGGPLQGVRVLLVFHSFKQDADTLAFVKNERHLGVIPPLNLLYVSAWLRRHGV